MAAAASNAADADAEAEQDSSGVLDARAMGGNCRSSTSWQQQAGAGLHRTVHSSFAQAAAETAEPQAGNVYVRSAVLNRPHQPWQKIASTAARL